MSDPTNPALAVCFLITLVTGVFFLLRKRSAQSADPVAPPILPSGRVQTWFYKPIDLLGPAVIFLIFFALFIMGVAAGDIDASDYTPSVMVFNIGFQFMIAGAAVTMALIRTTADSWLGLRWREWPWVFLIAPASVAAMWLIFYGLDFVGYSKLMESLGVETVQDTIQIFRDSNDPLIISLMVIAAVVVAPLCEELVFRGYFYPILKRFSGIAPAAICSSLFFAVVHSNLAVILPLFILSLLLIWVYEKTGSIWAPISIHLCFNLASVSVQLLLRFYEIEPANLGL